MPKPRAAEVPPTAALGIAHQRHCAQNHRHQSHLGVEGEGKGKGPCGSLCCGLSFPTPPLLFPVLWFHCVVACFIPWGTLTVTRMTRDVCWDERPGLGGGGEIRWGVGGCDAATRHHIYNPPWPQCKSRIVLFLAVWVLKEPTWKNHIFRIPSAMPLWSFGAQRRMGLAAWGIAPNDSSTAFGAHSLG